MLLLLSVVLKVTFIFNFLIPSGKSNSTKAFYLNHHIHFLIFQVLYFHNFHVLCQDCLKLYYKQELHLSGSNVNPFLNKVLLLVL